MRLNLVQLFPQLFRSPPAAAAASGRGCGGSLPGEEDRALFAPAHFPLLVLLQPVDLVPQGGGLGSEADEIGRRGFLGLAAGVLDDQGLEEKACVSVSTI